MRATVTRKELLDWLRAQPPETTYEYADNTDCVVARFLRAQGEIDVLAYRYRARVGDRDIPLERDLYSLVSVPTRGTTRWERTYADTIAHLESL